MKYPMRRAKQELSHDEAFAILERGTEGVLSLVDASGIPYGVPLNYVLSGSTLYFHSALEGRKIACIGHVRHASFCVMDETRIVPEEFTTYFRSIIASGSVRIVESEAERLQALMALCRKFSNDDAACEREVAKGLKRCAIIALSIEHISGKEAIELTRQRAETPMD